MSKTTVRVGENQANLANGTLHEVILDKALEKAHVKKRINPDKKEILSDVLKTKVDSYSIELHSFDEERLSKVVENIAENLTKTPGQLSHKTASKNKVNRYSRLVAEGNATDSQKREFNFISGINTLAIELERAAKNAELGGEPVLSSRRGRFVPLRKHVHTEIGEKEDLDKKVDLAFYEATFMVIKEQEFSLGKDLVQATTKNNKKDLAEITIDKSYSSAIFLALRTRHNPMEAPESTLPKELRKEGEVQQYASLLERTFPEMKEKIAKDKFLDKGQKSLLEAKVERWEKGVWAQFEGRYPQEKEELQEKLTGATHAPDEVRKSLSKEKAEGFVPELGGADALEDKEIKEAIQRHLRTFSKQQGNARWLEEHKPQVTELLSQEIRTFSRGKDKGEQLNVEEHFEEFVGQIKTKIIAQEYASQNREVVQRGDDIPAEEKGNTQGRESEVARAVRLGYVQKQSYNIDEVASMLAISTTLGRENGKDTSIAIKALELAAKGEILETSHIRDVVMLPNVKVTYKTNDGREIYPDSIQPKVKEALIEKINEHGREGGKESQLKQLLQKGTGEERVHLLEDVPVEEKRADLEPKEAEQKDSPEAFKKRFDEMKQRHLEQKDARRLGYLPVKKESLHDQEESFVAKLDAEKDSPKGKGGQGK